MGGITRRKVSWVYDADIRGFFDAIDHEWLIKFVKHRIADPRMIRLIRKWLRAGVSEDGQWSKTKVGTPQIFITYADYIKFESNLPRISISVGRETDLI